MPFSLALPAEPRNRPSFRGMMITLCLLVVVRLGYAIYLPGTFAPETLDAFRRGAATAYFSVFQLGVSPLFTVMIIAEILKLCLPVLQRWEGRTPDNAARMVSLIRYFALFLAALQALGIAAALEAGGRVPEPGWIFRLETMVTLVAATALLDWLATCITRSGFCNGFWLLLVAPSLAGVLNLFVILASLAHPATLQNPQLSIAVLAVPVVAVAMLVAISTSEYRQKVGRARIAGSTAAAIDVWPPLLAYPVASFAITIAASMPGNVRSFALVEPGQPLHMLAIAAFIAIIGYLRARTSGQAVSFLTSLMIVAQIIICLACEAVSHFAGVFGLIGGPFLIVVVALALDILYPQPKPL